MNTWHRVQTFEEGSTDEHKKGRGTPRASEEVWLHCSPILGV